MRKLFPWRIQLKGVVLESALFLGAYITWVIFQPAQSHARLFIGILAVLVPGVTAVVLIFKFLTKLPSTSQPAWKLLGFGLVFWSLGNLVRAFYEGVRGIPVPIFSLADIFSFMAYPILFSALILHPFENRYAPSRFRFLLDVTISAGAVATLVWLMLGRSVTSIQPSELTPLVYPIADLILLMILVNMLLANRKARRMLFLWGSGLFAFLVSDYIYSLLAPVNGYQAGGFESLGWTVGGLIFGCGVVFLTSSPVELSHPDALAYDLGTRIQNVLPFSFVLVLDWFVLYDWHLSGRLSWSGMLVSLLLTLALVIRMGVRAGEIELQKYWQLFRSMAEPIFICDGNGKILLGNPALLRALGLREANEITGKPLNAIFDEQTLPVDLLRRAALQECSLEVLLRLDRTAYLLSLSPILSENRKVMLAGAAQELSDQKRQQATIQKGYNELKVLHRQLEYLNEQLEQKVDERTHTLSEAYRQLEEQNKRLQELDQLKNDFVSMVSHELRTPLTSLNGGLELLLHQKGRSLSDRSTLALMKDEVGRLTRFVENILDYSATEAGRIRIDLAPVSLGEILKTVFRKFGAIEGANLLQVRLPVDLPPVLADEGVLQSIFNHLIDNAIKYAPDSPVVVEAMCKRKIVRVQVTDQGPGIPAAKRTLLFQRFQRLDAKDSQTVYGYGLGLYLSKRMLNAMQSDLAFEAPPEGGARFYFNLRVA